MPETTPPATRSKPRLSTGKLVALIIFALLLLVGIWVVVLGAWGVSWGRSFSAELEALQSEAERIGKESGASACTEAAMTQADECYFWQLQCRTQAQVFQEVCLFSSADLETYCEGVPEPFSLVDSMAHRLELCTGRNAKSNDSCQQVAQGIQLSCSKMRSQKQDPGE